MAAHSPRLNGLVPIHIAVHDPAGTPDPGPRAADYARELFEASAKYEGISWNERGAEPRWLELDTSTCAAAINPSRFHGQGADEFDRFLAGAPSRNEPALIIATMGNADEDVFRTVLSTYDAGVELRPGSMGGRRLPAGADIFLAAELDAADHDLGLRLRNRPADAPWWAMTLRAPALDRPHPEGELVPILVDSLAQPVVARWIPADAQQIWYIVPDVIDWNSVVDWIVQRALPAHIPAALRRVRSRYSIDTDLEAPSRGRDLPYSSLSS